jgi:serine/threonine protein kinase
MAPEVMKQAGLYYSFDFFYYTICCYILSSFCLCSLLNSSRFISLLGHGPPADIWSFGCTIIEMADGKPPFNEYTAMPSFFFDVLMNEKLPQIPDHLSPEAKRFVALCTQMYFLSERD